jgi:molybdopterin-guanine dinucleotide biosynthesis protein A
MRATAIVLAGGDSRRMGHDKALLRLGGRSVLERTAQELATVADEVIIAARERPVQPLGTVNTRWVPDFPGVAGPLAGLAAGLAAASHPAAFLVACDMPFLNGRLLSFLAESRGESDAVVPLCDGRPQPLHAVYHRRSLPTIVTLLRLGARSFEPVLPRLLVRYVPEDRCREIDPAGLSWFNMNTPEEYDRVQRLMSEAAASSVAA